MACIVKVTAGEVIVELRHDDHPGRCHLEARARRLLAVATASTLAQGTGEPPEPETRSIGFTATMERAEPVDLHPGWYDDEE